VSTNFQYRKKQVKTLTNKKGVYVLADLDNIPIYVGQSKDGIRKRVARHLTSARSDIIANRQIDVWEIAYVWTYPVEERNLSQIANLEAALFHHFNRQSQLMNGATLTLPPADFTIPDPEQEVQVMSDEEVMEKRDEAQRLPRQATHYAQIVAHFVAVKNSPQIALAMDAHFQRLKTYHQRLLNEADPQSDDNDNEIDS
jgi:Uri superfamily endonuclease